MIFLNAFMVRPFPEEFVRKPFIQPAVAGDFSQKGTVARRNII
jgi:hypothetical protein